LEAKAASEKRKELQKLKRIELLHKIDNEKRNKSVDSSGSGKNRSRFNTNTEGFIDLPLSGDFRYYNKLQELKQIYIKIAETEIKEELNKKMGIKTQEPDSQESRRHREVQEMEDRHKDIIAHLVRPFFDYSINYYHYFYVNDNNLEKTFSLFRTKLFFRRV
jgi:hypothetical protein